MRRSIFLVVVLALASTACNRSAEPELTTTTTTSGTGSSTPSGTATTPSTEAVSTTSDDSTPATTAPVKLIEDYEVQVATTADEGEVLWVTIPAEDYTDRDLENFVVTLFDEEEGLWEVHVLDDVEAVGAARVPVADRTEAEQQLVDDHYLISLTEGNVVTFRGPFESAGSFLIGS